MPDIQAATDTTNALKSNRNTINLSALPTAAIT